MNLKRKFNQQVLVFYGIFKSIHNNFNHNEKDNDCVANLSLTPNNYYFHIILDFGVFV